METALFILMVAIAVVVLACGEATGTQDKKGEEFDDFVEVESANAGITANAGIARTFKSMARAFLRLGNRPKKEIEMVELDFTADVANEELTDFWYNPANPLYWSVHSDFTDPLARHDD